MLYLGNGDTNPSPCMLPIVVSRSLDTEEALECIKDRSYCISGESSTKRRVGQVSRRSSGRDSNTGGSCPYGSSDTAEIWDKPSNWGGKEYELEEVAGEV